MGTRTRDQHVSAVIRQEEVTGTRLVRTEDQARRLAGRLLDPLRTHPVVVVTTAAGQQDPYLDVDEIVSGVGDLAEVHLLSTGDASWAFSQELPPQTQVYGGAARVYPADLSWTSDLRRSPLRFAWGAKDGRRATEQIISDALGMAFAAGLTREHEDRDQPHAVGRVMGVVGGRALVDLDGRHATIAPELTVPDVSAERLFAKGMEVSGLLDTTANRLDVRPSLIEPDELLQTYESGMQVLGRVSRLDAGGCHVELFPGMAVFVDGVDAHAVPKTRLTEVLSLHEVVLCRIVRKGQPTGKNWRLTLIDVAEDEAAFAAALLPGGPPWLELKVVEPEVDEPEAPSGPAHAAPAAPPHPSPSREELHPDARALHSMEVERDQLLLRVDLLEQRIDRLERDRARQRTQLRLAETDKVRLRRQVEEMQDLVAVVEEDGHRFSDPLEQLEFEIRLAWARRIPASDKDRRPLRAYLLGGDFLASLNEVEGVERSKVVDVIVEVLTGIVHEQSGRESHQLRVSGVGGSPYVTRPDGATCWRVALQQGTAAARRLHYWQLNDGRVELSAVRMHDDFRA